MHFDKPATTLADQIRILESRGLLITDRPAFEAQLIHIGYYRLSGYWLIFEEPPQAGCSRSHRLIEGTSDLDILNLYDADRNLRLLVMDAMERIETALRAAWVRHHTELYGPHGYLERSSYQSEAQQLKVLEHVRKGLKRSREPAIQHYFSRYSSPELPPVWMVAETLSFGTLCRFLKEASEKKLQKYVARDLGLWSAGFCLGVLQSLADIRNAAAHHARLVARSFPKRIPASHRWNDRLIFESSAKASQHQCSDRLYNNLVMMTEILRVICPQSCWQKRLIADLLRMQPRQLHLTGFPDDWLQRQPWCG